MSLVLKEGTDAAKSIGMENRTSLPLRRIQRTRGLRSRAGMTLVETIISLALLVVGGIASVYSFMLLNRYAVRQRYISEAKALCQERIEQAVTLYYNPPATLPVITGQDNVAFSLLGTGSNYTAGGVYTGAESHPETVTLYSPEDTSAYAVTGTRTTSVAPAAITDNSGTSALLPMVQFTVTVAWTVNGESRTYSMYTMRTLTN